LITVQNNLWGISTSYEGQHGETHIADRAKAFNIESTVMNGNDPIESYVKLKEAFEYIRKHRKPFFIEAMTSRLYGHSSASGANPIPEHDCVADFAELLQKRGLIKEKDVKAIWSRYETEAREAQETVRGEPAPQSDELWKHIYADNENADWRKF